MILPVSIIACYFLKVMTIILIICNLHSILMVLIIRFHINLIPTMYRIHLLLNRTIR